MFLPVLKETPHKPFIWGRKQQIPEPFKEFQSVPYFLPFYRSKKRAIKGQRGRGEPGKGRRDALPSQGLQLRLGLQAPGSCQGSSALPSRSIRVQTCAAAPIKPAPPFPRRDGAAFVLQSSSRQKNPTARSAFSFVAIKEKAV